MRLTKAITAAAVALAATAAALVPGGAAGAYSGQVVLSETWSSFASPSAWRDGTNVGQWTSTYNGYGKVGVQTEGTNKTLYQSPKASTRPDETHASLTLSQRLLGDMDMTVQMKTVRQLRTGSKPNPWETAWLIWRYTDDLHFYYFTLKPNGWELGKEDPAYPGAQRFLATGSSPQYPVGRWNTVRIRTVGPTVSVWADGRLLTTFTDTERPYALGRLGFYNEDAHVRFDNVKVSAP